MRTWIKNTLIAALGASMAFGGMAFATAQRGGCGWHGRGAMSEADSAKWREKVIDRASSELSLDAAQRQHLVALGDTLHAQRKAMLPEGTARPREQLAALIAGERFDAQRAQALVLEKTEAVRNASPSVIAAASNFYDSLRPDQQQKLRDFMARAGQHRGWGG
jgi:Spy/CpxP family protein refolding chaperone